MRQLRLVGRGASALKYDLLTAMGVFALATTPAEQRRVLRLMTLITARYNWTSDTLCVGQREIAAMWNCTERTVKREIAHLKAQGWLVVRRQGARGRVSEYRIDLSRILADTRPVWAGVGPDFEHRLTGEAALPPTGNVVPLRPGSEPPLPDTADVTEWGRARVALRAEDPGTYGAWVHALRREGRAGGTLRLTAPSRFHANYVETHLLGCLFGALRAVDPTVTGIDLGCRLEARE